MSYIKSLAGKSNDAHLRLHMVSPSISRVYTGVSEVVKNLSHSLSKHGAQVTIFTYRDDYTKLDSINWSHDIKIRNYTATGPSIFGYSRKMKKDLDLLYADLGHIQSLWSFSSYYLADWSLKYKKPLLLSSNGYLTGWAMNNSHFKKTIAMNLGFHKIFTQASCIQVNSIKEIEGIRNLGIKVPIAVIKNGVSLPDLIDCKTPPWAYRPEAREKKILLYLGRIDKKKGLDILLQAWMKVVKDGLAEDWHLVVVGFRWDKNIFEHDCRKYISDNNLEHVVSIFGGMFGSDMNACYANCNAFILPSFSEGNAIAVLHAWAHSKPVLITDECNFQGEALDSCGIKTEPNIHSVFCGIVKTIKLESESLDEFGRAGRTFVEQNHSWDLIAKDYIRLYQWMLDPTPGNHADLIY